METTVYVDLFFLVNFSMDFLCLYLTARLLNIKNSPLRWIAAATFGGGYAATSLFLPTGRLAGFALDVLACVILCAVAFLRSSQWRRLPLYILIYTAISMALGGFMTALFNLFNRIPLFDKIKESDGDGISVWLFALLAALSGVITLIGGRFFSSRMARRRVGVTLVFGKKRVSLEGFTDNGNLLRDPIGGKPCIVADVESLSAILPREILGAAGSGELLRLDGIPSEYQRRVLIIPTHTAAGDGMLLGVRMDEIIIEEKGKSYAVDAVVALSKLENRAEGAKALMPACLLV